MDLVDLIMNPGYFKYTCLLCLKLDKQVSNIYEEVEIHDQWGINSTCFSKVVETVIKIEVMTNVICEDCKVLILKLYINIRKQQLQLSNYKKILSKISNEIDKKSIKYILHNSESKPIRKKGSIKITLYSKNDAEKESKNINSIKLLGKHKKIQKEKDKALVCDICGKLFEKAATLKRHYNCHNVKKCPYCSRILKTHYNFNIHLKKHHAKINPKPRTTYYNCKDCDYKSKSRDTLQAHIYKAHLQIRPYICPKCPKGFFRKSNMLEHAKTHCNTKNETCEICGENFVSRKTLNTHLKGHTTTKDEVCEFCHERFINKSRMMEHIKRKHLEKPFYCAICGRRFGLKSDLNRHTRRIHNENLNCPNVSNIDG